jgi:hypothetical protein
MNTFTAQELADFYQQAADGGEIEYTNVLRDHWEARPSGPNLYDLTNRWRIKPADRVCTRCDKPIYGSFIGDGDGTGQRFAHIECYRKPANKVIDLSVLIDSQIDCEFSDDGDVWATSNLSWLVRSGDYVDKAQHAWKYCKPRMNHIHAIDVEDFEEAGNIREKLAAAGFVFSFDTLNYISGCVLLIWGFGIDDGYVMPWESE